MRDDEPAEADRTGDLAACDAEAARACAVIERRGDPASLRARPVDPAELISDCAPRTIAALWQDPAHPDGATFATTGAITGDPGDTWVALFPEGTDALSPEDTAAGWARLWVR